MRHRSRDCGAGGEGSPGRGDDMGILILFVLAALLFRCQGGAWPVVVCEPLAVLILYLLVIYVVFGVGIGELP